MIREPVRSSNVSSVGYDEPTRTLEVEFKNRSVYQYFDVSSSEHQALMRSSSIGRYLNTQIKRRHRYRKVH